MVHYGREIDEMVHEEKSKVVIIKTVEKNARQTV